MIRFPRDGKIFVGAIFLFYKENPEKFRTEIVSLPPIKYMRGWVNRWRAN